MVRTEDLYHQSTKQGPPYSSGYQSVFIALAVASPGMQILRPTSDLLNQNSWGGSISPSFNQPLGILMKVKAESHHATVSVEWKLNLVLLQVTSAFLSPRRISLFLHLVSFQCQGHTYFHANWSLNKSSREDTVMYFKTRENLAGLTLLRSRLSISGRHYPE